MLSISVKWDSICSMPTDKRKEEHDEAILEKCVKIKLRIRHAIHHSRLSRGSGNTHAHKCLTPASRTASSKSYQIKY
jgi:hypothetical protein